MLSSNLLTASLPLLAALAVLGQARPADATELQEVASVPDPSNSDADRFKQAVLEATRTLAEDGSVFIMQPRYDVGEGTIEYHLGDVNSKILGSNDQFALAVEVQLRVQMLHNLFKLQAKDEQFWQGPMAALSQVAEQATSGPDFDRREIKRQFNKALRVLEDAIDADAAARGLTAKRRRSATSEEEEALEELEMEAGDGGGGGGESNKARFGSRFELSTSKRTVKKFAVSIRTDPPNATIEYINNFDLELALSSGMAPGWQTVATEKTRLLGIYVFAVTWSDGSKTRHKITVSSADPITIRRPDR
jgi:hypothetical protein